MERLFLILVFFAMTFIIVSLLFRRSNDRKLPPGPSFLLSHVLLLTNSLTDLHSIIKDLKSKYGPLITLSIGSHRSFFVSSNSLAHQLLIKKGTSFSDRPKSYTLQGISTASYGPTWRVFRHNLASNFLRPSHVKSYSYARKWALSLMIGQLQEQQLVVGTIKVIDHIQLAMLRLFVLMCLGQKLDECSIDEIAKVTGGLLSLSGSLNFNAFIASPWLAKTLFRNKWKYFDQLCEDQNQLLIPLIESRTKVAKSNINSETDDQQCVAYIDTLVKLHLPDKGLKLTPNELVSMCGEFLITGTEATSSALEWIMANLVKHPGIQSKLYDEIVAVVGPPPPPPRHLELQSIINEENLQKITYLKAVVLEGLRRHPPAHLLLPHLVTADIDLQGYMIPKGSTINFMVAEMGLDPKVWDDPLEFKPERFLRNGVFDISGSKEIKMMPFGAGKRMCPGSDLALLHLEYFVANLIWYFHWTVPDGYRVDLSEQLKNFSVAMKNPLRTKICSRTT